MFARSFIAWSVMLFREQFWSYTYKREFLTAPDGGKVALDWFSEEEEEENHDDDDDDEKKGPQPDLPEDAPIMLIVSTLAGGPMSYPNCKPLSFFAQKGYRSVCYVKRGCGIQRPNPYVTAKAWCLLDYEDLTMVVAIDHISKKYPKAKIFAIGLSTGGGQIRNYMSRMGGFTKIAAAVACDAGHAWDRCIVSLDRRLPVIAQCLARAVATNYIDFADRNPNHARNAGVDVKRLKSLKNMEDLVTTLMAPTNGYRGKSYE
eukprot:jgi/Bigna1/142801/aug1.73_g17509